MLDDTLKGYKHGTNQTLDGLCDNPASAAVLFAELGKLGLRDVSSERLGGTTAIVVQSAPGEVLRICKEGLEAPRDASDFRIWQPARDLGVIAGHKVEIYSKANPLDKALEAGQVSAREAFDLTQQLVGECAREGKFLWDLKPDNLTLAKTRDGQKVLFVLDEGAVAPMAEMHGGKISSDTHTNLDKFVIEMSEVAKKAGVDDTIIRANPEAYIESLKLSGQDVANREAIQKSTHSIYMHESAYAPMLTNPAQGKFTARWHAQKQQREQAAYTVG